MRKIIVLLLTAMVAVSASAQIKSKLDRLDNIFKPSADKVTFAGDITALKGMASMQVVEDLSKITISGLDIDHWLKFRQAEQPDYNAKNEWENELRPSFRAVFVPFANEALIKVPFVLSEDIQTDTILVMEPHEVNRNGDCNIVCYVRRKGSTDNLVTFYIQSRGGVFGSMSNLWGDGLKSAGKRFGKFLVNKLKELK